MDTTNQPTFPTLQPLPRLSLRNIDCAEISRSLEINSTHSNIIDSWSDIFVKELLADRVALGRRHKTLSNLILKLQAGDIPTDLGFRFNGYHNYPKSIAKETVSAINLEESNCFKNCQLQLLSIRIKHLLDDYNNLLLIFNLRLSREEIFNQLNLKHEWITMDSVIFSYAIQHIHFTLESKAKSFDIIPVLRDDSMLVDNAIPDDQAGDKTKNLESKLDSLTALLSSLGKKVSALELSTKKKTSHEVKPKEKTPPEVNKLKDKSKPKNSYGGGKGSTDHPPSHRSNPRGRSRSRERSRSSDTPRRASSKTRKVSFPPEGYPHGPGHGYTQKKKKN